MDTIFSFIVLILNKKKHYFFVLSFWKTPVYLNISTVIYFEKADRQYFWREKFTLNARVYLRALFGALISVKCSKNYNAPKRPGGCEDKQRKKDLV